MNLDRKTDFVSVIIPCYNHGSYIHEAIDSVLEQTYDNIEIIVVNDGSNDQRTNEILLSIDKPKTRVFHKENGGPSSARNFGIGKSAGEFILTLDSDDKFAPTFLEKAVKILKENPETGMVTSYHLRFGEHRKTEKNKLTGGSVTDLLTVNNAVACLLYRYQCWVDAGGYDEDIPGFEDWEFNINVTKQGWTIYSIPEYLFYYRDVKGSGLDRHQMKRPEIIKYMVEKHRDLYQQNIVDVIYKKDRKIKELNEMITRQHNSYAYKLGNLLLRPLRFLKSLPRTREHTILQN